MYGSDGYPHERERGDGVRDAFEVILDGSREPAFPSVTDAAVVGGRRIRRRRTAVSGAVGALVAAVLVAGAVAALPGAGPDRSSVPMAPASSPPAATDDPESPRPSAVPSEPAAVPTPSGGVPRPSSSVPTPEGSVSPAADTVPSGDPTGVPSTTATGGAPRTSLAP